MINIIKVFFALSFILTNSAICESEIAKKYKEECFNKNFNACTILGLIYTSEGRYAKAFNIYTSACELGDSINCKNLGFLYLRGNGIEQNIKKAIKYFKKACKGGEAESCDMVGMIFESGLDTKQDDKKAREYFKQGCILRYEASCKKYKAILKKVSIL